MCAERDALEMSSAGLARSPSLARLSGIDSAFMSTTFDRDVAMHYASAPGKPALVFEIQMGMIDRGAELGWISQYPHESECLFAPLTGAGARVVTVPCAIARYRVQSSQAPAQMSPVH